MDNLDEYLTGKSFSNAYPYKIADQKNYLVVKQWYVADLVREKKIIHFGCVDHQPLIDEKIRNNNYTHKILADRASRCAGIDINTQGIAYLSSLGFEDLFVMDAIHDPLPDALKQEQWDYLVLPEVLEHVDNTRDFLTGIRQKFKNHVEKILVTTPNYLYYRSVLNAFKNIELINSDHKYYFSPYTLQKNLTGAGFTPEKMLMINSASSRNIFIRKLLGKYQLFNDTVLVIAKL